ncbi:NAD(P)H-quinone oxidoreductase subunit F [Synechococcus sp. W60.2]|uniref:NAD(P)H-quinone oxidoreductase subunit F n=1 Tax=unclassified Synechococcus TaxID=2626047 RepID=UPI0039C06A4E
MAGFEDWAIGPESAWCLPFYGWVGTALALPWAAGWIKRSGPRPAAYLNILLTFAALAHSFWLLRQVWGRDPQLLNYLWFRVADLDLSLALEVSPLTLGAVVWVSGLSLLAQIYALGYLDKDWGLGRFAALMGFFEGGMTGIALSDSLFLSYALLEMLTLSTYLLVGFWYAQPLVVTAARDAFLTKRVGDLLLLMGVVAVSNFSGSLTFSGLRDWAATASLDPTWAALMGLALIAGPLGKCAQFPLHLWLDEAMEAPNPASILRNSAVVAAGAFVLIKLQPVLALSPFTDGVLVAIGTITAVGGSLVALAQIDLKRTFSYSTSAYLGLVFGAVGTGQPDLALELLLLHGLAKALLFMGVGSLIYTTSTQDLTELGGLGGRMPATVAAFAVGSLGMVALLPLGCFWILIRLALVYSALQPALLGVLLLMNGLTALNLARVFGLVFLGSPQPKTRRAPEVGWPMALPMVILTVQNLLMPWLFWRWGLYPSWIPELQQMAALLAASGLLGAGVGAWLYWGGRRRLRLPWPELQDLLAQDFYTGQLYQALVVQPVGALSRGLEWLDRNGVDGLVNGVSLAFWFSGEALKYTLSGRMQLYVLLIVIGVVVVTAWLLRSPLVGLAY